MGVITDRNHKLKVVVLQVLSQLRLHGSKKEFKKIYVFSETTQWRKLANVTNTRDKLWMMLMRRHTLVGHVAWADIIMPTMTPNNPSALPKISITRILTKSVEFWASDKAQLLPMIPTHSLQEGKRETREVGKGQTNLIQVQVYLIKLSKSRDLNLPTNKVSKANDDSRCKYSIASSHRFRIISLWCRHAIKLCLKNDSNNNSIYCNSLTENHTERITLKRLSHCHC